MDDNATHNSNSAGSTGLQHVSRGGQISRQPGRLGIIGRGRRDAAATTSNAAYAQAIAHYRAGEVAQAAAAFRTAAEQGHAESQYVLSTLYDTGEGVAQSDTEAALWEQKAADQGHAYAQANVSFRYYAANDFENAFQWCRRAAESTLPWAQYNLGLMHRKGEGTPPSDAQAALWYRLAAEQDYAEAQQKLAEMYHLGRGVPRSSSTAAAWYRRAALQGNAEAQYQLGLLYAIGDGVETDYVQSRQWIREAAQQGHPAAMDERDARSYRDAY